MSLPTIIFWFLAATTAGSALLVVLSRNILHAGFALCLTFLGVAGIYIFLHADFIAAVQLIVYVGGILVLILFAIMFSANVVEDVAEGRRNRLSMLAGGLTALAMLGAFLLIIKQLAAPLALNQSSPYVPTVSVAPGQTGIGHLLMGQYLLPFEVVSILLLAALIGAVVIVRKELK
ncbi:MAG TPA: NADH-quinone oxidoreductase subunit J [Planctomycetota bacterium]|jgi:NADH-quinone oxidoreductase subunit J